MTWHENVPIYNTLKRFVNHNVAYQVERQTQTGQVIRIHKSGHTPRITRHERSFICFHLFIKTDRSYLLKDGL